MKNLKIEVNDDGTMNIEAHYGYKDIPKSKVTWAEALKYAIDFIKEVGAGA